MDTTRLDPLVAFAEKHAGQIWSDEQLAKSVLSRLVAPAAKRLRKVATGALSSPRPVVPASKPAPAPVTKTHKIGRFSDDGSHAALAPAHASVRDFPQAGDVVRHSSGAQWRVNRVTGGHVHLVDHQNPGTETSLPYAVWKRAHDSGSLSLPPKADKAQVVKAEDVLAGEEMSKAHGDGVKSFIQGSVAVDPSSGQPLRLDRSEEGPQILTCSHVRVVAKSYADSEQGYYPLDTDEQIIESWSEFHDGGEEEYDTQASVIVKSAIAVAARRRGIALAPDGGVYGFHPGTELSGIMFAGDRPFFARVIAKSGTTVMLEKNPDGSRKSQFQMTERDLARLVGTDLMAVTKDVRAEELGKSTDTCRRCGSGAMTIAPQSGYCDACLSMDFHKPIAAGWA